MNNPYKEFDTYGMRHLLTHLMQAEAWEGLEQIFSDAAFIEAKCIEEMIYELIVDYNEVILRTPDVYRILENIWNGLSVCHTELLQPFLHRFLYVATIPDQRVLKHAPKEEEIEISSRFRLPHPTYWPPMVQFLGGHKDEVIKYAPNEVATIAEQWLLQSQSQSYQKEAAELGLAVAWRVFYRDDCYTWYRQKSVDPKTAYRAVLASVPALPDQSIEFILIACGRQDAPPPPPELAEPAETLPERYPNLPIPPLGSIFPEVAIPPWPDGPRWQIDRHFHDVCLNESHRLMPLMALYPEIARELILALLIREPGMRPKDWSTNEYYCDYELQDKYGWFPPFYTGGPFFIFLSMNANAGLELVLRLVNFATEQWKDRRRVQSQEVPFVKIPFPDGEKKWFGERRMYTTYRDSTLFPDVIVCALMALEWWFYDHLEKEDDISRAIVVILKETQSLAFAGLLIGIGKKYPVFFNGLLKPLLAVPEFYYWETIHQFEGEGHHMIGWDRRRHTEHQIKQAYEWHAMPHRKLELNTVVLSLFLHDEGIRQFIENAREQWRIRLQNSIPDDPLYDRLNKLIREFDINNWQQEEHPGFEVLWTFQPPEDFQAQVKREYPQFLEQQRLLLFPSQCRQRLTENRPFAADELEMFWNSLQRIEQFTAVELEDFSQHLRENRDFGTTIDDSEIGKRYVRDALCGGAAVLIHLHREWLCVHPQKEEWCIRIIVESILTPPSFSPLDSEDSVYDINWDNFCAYAVPILWAEEPKSELWRELIVRLVIHPHYITTKMLFLQAVKYRQTLGDDFLRLQHLILRWAWVCWHLHSQRYYLENERQRNTYRKKVSKKFDQVVKQFIGGSLSVNPPSWEELAAEQHKQPRHIYKKHYFPRSPGLDITLIRHAFDGLPLLAEASDNGERQRWIAFWQEALNCVLRIIGNGNEEIEEIDGTPGEFEGWVFDKIVPVILQLLSSKEQQRFWKPIFQLGTPAHYWIESFLLRWFFDGLASNQYQEAFVHVWQEMLDFAFNSPKWTYNPARRNHRLEDLWYRLMGLDGNFLQLWNEQKTAIVNEMRNYYARWAPLHLFHGYNTSAFIAFLQTPATRDIRMDGLLWLDQAASTVNTDFKYEQESLARLFVFYWEHHRVPLRQHPQYWEAFLRLLKLLAMRGNNIAIELSGRISLEHSKI